VTGYVFDASAFLALLFGEEPAASRALELLLQAREGTTKLSVSLINLGEVFYRVGRERGETDAHETLDDIRRLPLDVLPASTEAVLAAASLKMTHSISYPDAFAAAAALSLDAILVTGDAELLQMRGPLRVEALSRAPRA